ncbi:unnamed protein product [Owenia fusiformis]|uniref:LicD/FKTN/FKRP nucleotidyltransferase domain-containing protein n=1 Tax=Owenia fusiformis TaxID=6347 RepID=A0A8J1U3Y6_OWEFU|nr:unnamed protein product [Owenia fusiformis]
MSLIGLRRRRLIVLIAIFCIAVLIVFLHLGMKSKGAFQDGQKSLDGHDLVDKLQHISNSQLLLNLLANISSYLERPERSTQIDAMASTYKHSSTKKAAATNKPQEINLDTIPVQFKQSMTPRQKMILFDLMDKLDKVMTEQNILYLLYGGSLLGSYRHHDLIPWDDDIDIFVPLAKKEELVRAVATLGDHYKIVPAGPRMKLFSDKSNKTSRFSWKWPYVDISFYAENATHIMDSSKEFKNYIYPKNVVFPLHRRPLGTLMLFAPKDTYANLKLTYTTMKNCQSYFYSHMLEKLSKNPKLSMPCSNLKRVVPFVHRTLAKTGINESLWLNEKFIHSYVINEPQYAMTDPFGLELMQ